jgi:hypothetical protein
VFAFLRYVSIHLGTFCDSSAISSRGTPIRIRIIRIRDGSADQQIVFSSKNLGNPLPNQGRDSCRSLAAASNGKRIDNGYCWIVYFKRNDPAKLDHHSIAMGRADIPMSHTDLARATTGSQMYFLIGTIV